MLGLKSEKFMVSNCLFVKATNDILEDSLDFI